MASRNPEIVKECKDCGKSRPHWTYKNGRPRARCVICYNPALRAVKRAYVKRHSGHPEWKKVQKARRMAQKAFPFPKNPACESCGRTPSAPYPVSTVNGLQRSHEEGYDKPLVIKWNCPDCHFKRDRWAVGKTHGYAPWHTPVPVESETVDADAG